MSLREHALGLLRKWEAEGHDLGDNQSPENALKWFVAYEQANSLLEGTKDLARFLLDTDWTAIQKWDDKTLDDELDFMYNLGDDLEDDLEVGLEEARDDMEVAMANFFQVPID